MGLFIILEKNLSSLSFNHAVELDMLVVLIREMKVELAQLKAQAG